MKIIIAGAGEVGTHLAKMLSSELHDIIIIDNNEESVKGIDANLDILTITGSATSFEVLKEASVKRSDLLIAVTHSEETNIACAILAKKLGAKQTIARVDNPEYIRPVNKNHFTDLGIDYLIYPERIAAKEISGMVGQTGTSEIVDFTGGKLSLYVLKLEENAPVIGKTLTEVTESINEYDFRAVAITRNGHTIIPRGLDRFQINDLAYVVTNKAGISNVLKYSGKKKSEVKNVMILGGSRIGKRTAQSLENRMNVKLIEMDKQECTRLADELNNTLVINGDGRDVELLKEEGLAKMDTFIAVTGSSEVNLLSCLLAKKMGVKKTIAEIENIDYINLGENMGIDTIINKKLVTASRIFKFTMSAEVSTMKCLTGSDAEVLEFVARPKSKITKYRLKDLNFPKEAIVGGIIRGNNSFIAKGDTKIQAEDRVVVFAMPSAVKKVETFFN
ncbi:MAG: Trk system potassium transporter TrkA [Bacteroidales bacterium]|nr:Trk system potassium transporter TrkA [Bacteroidales bacterium]